MLAACTQEQPALPVFVIMELMTKGSLLEYLRGCGRSLKIPQLIQMSTQVANGMAYLEKKMCTHRNLAAKNVLLSYNLICKVVDYGMTQEGIYKDHSQVGFALRWTAPEAVTSNQFTIKSDV